MRASIARGRIGRTKGGLVAALLAAASAAALGSAGCGESTTAPAPTANNGSVSTVQSAVTQITISGRVTKSGNVGVANIPIRLNGQSQAWALTNSTGNYSFTVSPGSYSVRPEEATCTFVPDVVNLNNLTQSTVRNFTVSGTMCQGTQTTPRAMILVDARLYAQLATNIDQYKALAEARRGFAIDLRRDQQFDEWTYTAIKNYIVSARTANPSLEGVLFIGNIKLPSFYKARIDLSLTRLYPRYYEDLDGVFGRRYATGEIDPVCPPTIVDGDQKCVISPRADGGSGPVTVLAHDFDDTNFGPNPGVEIWTSYMPVGVVGAANTYTDFANQLRPYLQKLARYYNHEFVTNGRYYYVSNDPGEQFGQVWSTWGKTKIDFYGKPGPQGQTDGACLVNGTNVCYVRWSTENYADAASFLAARDALPFVGEGWQQDTIYISHMNAQLYDVADVNVHSESEGSLVGQAQAKLITNAGLIAVSSGCGVGGFAQPGAPTTTAVDVGTMASTNIMLAYLYGSSKAVASLGAPAWRGHYGHYPTMYESLKLGGATAYLGSANKARLDRLYAQSAGNKWELKENTNEMMFGDPFMDLRP
jgi:hypothetical protein